VVRRALVVGAALAAVLTGAAAARANGRFPEANQLVLSPDDPDVVVLRVTFGLLVSHDRGETFQWVCETSIGYSGVEDPMYALTPSRAIVGTTFQGVTVSRDGACNWAFAGGELAGKVFADLAWNPSDRKDLVVLATGYDTQDDAGNVLFTSNVWETKDEAETFTKLGAKLDPTLLAYTIDLSKSDPSRIYVTAAREPGTAPKAVLLVSRDHGQTWQEEPVPLVEGEREVFIAGVDPTNAERVYLRTSAGTDQPTRLILRDAQGGAPATLRTVYTAKAALLGFALSPDGGKVYVGGPKDGLLTASTQDLTFAQRLPFDDAGVPSVEVQCLAWGDDGLWACSNERSGFIAGVSRDDGATFEPRLRFCDVGGPLASCGPGTMTNDLCAPSWPAQKALLGCSRSDAGGAADSGPGGGGPSAAPTGGGGPRTPEGCDCHAAPAGPWGAFVAAAAAAVAVLRRLQRRGR
jgi:hypothetical protein